MPRWSPNARERLESAALELYADQGYEQTTVGDVAARAGVTPRTYFRYFPDKREVLFANADTLIQHLRTAVGGTPGDVEPMVAALRAVRSCGPLFRLRDRDELERRESVIASAVELREREAHKLDTMARVVAQELRGRQVDQTTAELVAGVAIVVFAHASRLWRSEPSVPFERAVDDAAGQALALLGAASLAGGLGAG